MDFNDYKKNKELRDAYYNACKIQEGFALAAITSEIQQEMEYEGHLAVSDVLNKIDSMIRVFEKYLNDNSYKITSEQMINIIENLYDLADIKLCESKNKCLKYMKKVSGGEHCGCEDKKLTLQKNTQLGNNPTNIQLYRNQE